MRTLYFALLLAIVSVELYGVRPLTIGDNALSVQAQPPAPTQDLTHPQNTNAGIYAFTEHCASCHDAGTNGARDRYSLNRHTPEEVLSAMTTGSMAKYAQGLTEFEKRVVASRLFPFGSVGMLGWGHG